MPEICSVRNGEDADDPAPLLRAKAQIFLDGEGQQPKCKRGRDRNNVGVQQSLALKTIRLATEWFGDVGNPHASPATVSKTAALCTILLSIL